MGGVRGKSISREVIYDALFDDAIFDEVPGLLAVSVGARSCSMFWTGDKGAHILSHSRYYSDEQLDDYAANFSIVDPWVNAAIRPDTVGRVWKLDDLVPEKTYRSTSFYNDWIKGMGDDAFHCLGISTVSPFGNGIIGLHRGKGAPLFQHEDVSLLKHQVQDLRRMLTLRGRIASLEASKQRRGLILDNLPTKIFLIARTNVLTYCNAAAEKRRPYWLRSNRVGVVQVEHRELEKAIQMATDRAAPTATTLAISPGADERADLISIIPYCDAGGKRLAMLMIAAPPAIALMEGQLRSLFQLTAAEAAVAVHLGKGDTPAAIAEQRSTSLNTVRVQIKAVTAKMGCNRLAEVAAVIARLQTISG